jgi:hypothetical protein
MNSVSNFFLLVKSMSRASASTSIMSRFSKKKASNEVWCMLVGCTGSGEDELLQTFKILVTTTVPFSVQLNSFLHDH